MTISKADIFEWGTYLAVTWGIGLTDIQLIAQVGTSVCVFALAALRLGRTIKNKGENEKENNERE